MSVVFWTLMVAGFVGCATTGIGPVLERSGGKWTSPHMVAGSVLGVALVGLAAAYAADAAGLVPGGEQTMVLVAAGLIGTKVLVARGSVLVARAGQA